MVEPHLATELLQQRREGEHGQQQAQDERLFSRGLVRHTEHYTPASSYTSGATGSEQFSFCRIRSIWQLGLERNQFEFPVCPHQTGACAPRLRCRSKMMGGMRACSFRPLTSLSSPSTFRPWPLNSRMALISMRVRYVCNVNHPRRERFA